MRGAAAVAPGGLGHGTRNRAPDRGSAAASSITDPLDTHTCTVTGTIALELFQRTKSAHAFTFFLGPLSSTLHDVKVKAQGFIECRANGEPIECSKTTLGGYTAQTKAVIGKATLLLEEHNNWGVK